MTDPQAAEILVVSDELSCSYATFESAFLQQSLRPAQLSFVKIYGEGGMLNFSSNAYTAYDIDGKEIAKNTEGPGDVPHFQNFADAVREGTPLNQPISEGQKSALLCHLANIAYRTGRTLFFDGARESFVDDREADRLLTRDYRDPYVVPEEV